MISDNKVYKNGTSKGNIKYYISYRPEHKLEYVDPCGRTVVLHRLVAKNDILIGDLKTGKLIESGTIGGYVEGGKNLSQFGCCWVDKTCIVCGDAHIKGNVEVSKNSVVYGQAVLSGEGQIVNSTISGSARIHNADVKNSTISDDAFLYSQHYVPRVSLSVNESTIDKNSFIANEGEGFSSLYLKESCVTDDTVISINSESVDISKRIFVSKSNICGQSQVVINTLNEQPIVEENHLENYVKVNGSEVVDSFLISNQAGYNISVSSKQLNGCSINPQESCGQCESVVEAIEQ